MATSTVEDYLKTILLAEEQSSGLVGMGEIAEALGVTPGTVTSMVKTLSESALVDYAPYSGVRLTESGRSLALHVVRRHRLIELFLVQVMGLSWSEVHAEAELLEHAASDALIARMDEMLGHPSVDPHGDPIPNAQGEFEKPDLQALDSCVAGDRVTVCRVEDQGRDFLRLLDRLGLVPGSQARVLERENVADSITVENASGRSVSLGLRVARKVLISKRETEDLAAARTPESVSN